MIESIRALRGIAVFVVVIHHVLAYVNSRQAFATLPEFLVGASGVDVFFVVSGYVMYVSTRKAEVGFSACSGFLVRRLIRVLPMYWLVTLVLFGTYAVAPQVFGTWQVTPSDVVKSLLFIPLFDAGGLLRPVLYQGWTLYFEMYFYITFGFVLMFSRERRVELTVIALFALGSASAYFGNYGVVTGSPLVLEFIAGMLLARWGNPLLRMTSPYAGWGCLILLAAAAAWVDTTNDTRWGRVLHLGGVGLGTFLLVHRYWDSVRATLPRLAEGFGVLGDASYSIYLTHGIAFSLTWKILGAAHARDLLPVVLAGLCVGSLALGILCYHGVEKPLLNGLSKLLPKRQPQPR